MSERGSDLQTKSNIHAVTVAHGPPEILAYSLARLLVTAGHPIGVHIVVDNHWPMDRETTGPAILKAARIIRAFTCQPDKNIGGHEGFNFGWKQIRHLKGDLILGYDYDSNPMTPGWLKAMKEVMDSEKTLDYLSLLVDPAIVDRPWKIQSIAGHRVAFLERPEMMNVTIWRTSYLEEIGGLKGQGFYGHVERLLWRPGRSGYLYDFREEACPIPSPKEYIDWKRKHALEGYPKNFDEYLRELQDAV